MNDIINASIAARNEITELSSVSNWLISHTTSSPAIGQVDDSIIGIAELTKSNVSLNKYHSMLLFAHSMYLPSFSDIGKEPMSGRDCVSKLLEETPINFTRMAEWYKPNMSQWLKYDPEEIRVVIDQGKLKSGVLDKKSVGKGANGGIYHLIANEYGNKRALEVMFNMQQIAIAHIMHTGYTIGIMDMMLTRDAKTEIDRIAADIINKSKLITERLNNGEIIPPIGKTVEEFYEEQQINTLSLFDDFNEPILKSINPNTNNLFKLINHGSKGKIEQMFNMVSAVGQKLINGERIRQKFGFKRTLAYFPRFDNSPEARGYITNSYLVGMTSSEYVFNAMAARFDLISKALSTSVTGEQNRKSIKNLESILINHFRMAIKDRNIVQIAYGEDFLDPRRVERVKFPTVMSSDTTFTLAYSHSDFPEEFAMMKRDRVEYRKVFSSIEHMNVREMLTEERRMPVDINRMIDDILRENIDVLKASPDQLKTMVASVTTLCDNLPYTIINEIQEKRRGFVPEHIRAATWLLTMLIRSHLHPNALLKRLITPPVLRIILEKIRLRYSQALIEPGTASGIIAAQSFSEPLTQYMLDAHHRSATGGTSKSGMTRAKEVLGAKDISKLDNPSMLIPVLPEYESNRARVQEIANNIEVMKFHQFVILWQIFFEKFGEPVYESLAHERTSIQKFTQTNPLLTPPGDLVKWCIRCVLNKTTLILKNMSLDLIITRLREMFPDLYIVYTPENAKLIVIRIYMRSSLFKGSVTTNDVKDIKEQILQTIIRGVDGITNASVTKMVRNKINPDGSIIINDNIWGITTSGTNIAGVMTNRFIDRYRVHTDAIQEMNAMFGIEAARQKVVSSLRDIVPDINHRHYLVYADEMTYTGKVTSIESSGLKTRESNNVLLRIGFVSPLVTMEEAAVNSMEDTVTGITAPLLLGSIPRHGTLYDQFHVNEEFVRNNVKRPDDLLEALF